MRRYLEVLKKSQPASLFGYPSSISLLCEYANSIGFNLRDTGIKAVFCTGEVLYKYQRKTIANSFGVPVTNGYGARDAGFIAHECPEGGMHIAAEHIIVEVCDTFGNILPPGEVGEIVITNLDGLAMPLIRYATGDLGALSEEHCSCGRGLPLMKVLEGRTTDFIMTSDGNRMHALGLIYVLREMPGICQFQIIQNDLDRIEVNVVKNDEFPLTAPETITQAFKKRVGVNVSVKINFVDKISVQKSGKFRYVISNVQDNMSLVIN
jgi:phenylacetate-CoA ligase